MKILTVVLLVAGAGSAAAQDDLPSRIRKRLQEEMAEALSKTRQSLKELVLHELTVIQQSSRIDKFARSLAGDPLHDRLRDLLLTKEGKDLVREFLEDQRIESFEAVIDQYFEQDKSGKYRVREELEEMLMQILDTIEPPKPGTLGFELGENPGGAGMKVIRIAAGGAVAAAGLKPGDLIVSVAGKDLTPANVRDVMKRVTPGMNVTIVYERDKVRSTVSVKAR